MQVGSDNNDSAISKISIIESEVTSTTAVDVSVAGVCDVISLSETSLNPTIPTTPSTTSAPVSVRPTTPIVPKKFSRRHPNLNVKIPATTKKLTTSPIAETDNATLSGVNRSLSSPSTSSTIFPHEQNKKINKLNIDFDNITFTLKAGLTRKENRNILSGLTGEFRAGELNAIIGPSGAGKSTLLNILSAYRQYGYSGNVNINGKPRDIKAFKPNMAFILQDTSLQPFLTVHEAMKFAATLKIGPHMSKVEKLERVKKILEAIGIYEDRNTRTDKLSGGQKKRLAIALELVNNPPILILDEPTSGLDSSCSTQLVILLKKLAMEGRNVICTIHQASATIFELFDHIYAIAEGQCIYSGGPRNLVPFLAESELFCPQSYNPADYLMEIATDDYGKQNHKLMEKIRNGRYDGYRQKDAEKKGQVELLNNIIYSDNVTGLGLTPIMTPSPQYVLHFKFQQQQFKQLTPIQEMASRIWENQNMLDEDINLKSETASKKKTQSIQMDPVHLCKRENIYATSFVHQLSVLLLRTFLIFWRDKSLTTLRFVIHFMTALLIGFLYYGIGNDAANALNNFRYAFYTIMFIMYCAFSAILVKFPLEFPIVSREHFNRWYSLRAYYVALTLADIPIQIICTGLFVVTTYFLTGQPLELFRISLFFLIVFLTALVAQSIGLAVGASLSVQLGAIFGPFFICPFLIFSGFFLQKRDAPELFKPLFMTSFLKYSLDGATLSLFGYDRANMECNDIYCHYARPKTFLRDLDMEHADYTLAALFLLFLFIGLRIIAFYIMSFRLRLFR